MKIYDKPYFACGVLCLCALPLFAWKVLAVGWLQWVLALALSARFLYLGLSKTASERQRRIAKNYRRVSRALYGKHAVIKTNLPWFLTGGFFASALLVRYALDLVIPVWIAVCFVVLLACSAFYSMGLSLKIREHIENEAPPSGEHSP